VCARLADGLLLNTLHLHNNLYHVTACQVAGVVTESHQAAKEMQVVLDRIFVQFSTEILRNGIANRHQI